MATAAVNGEPATRGRRLKLPERLPDLKGKWVTLYTIVWAIMLPVAIVSSAYSAYLIGQRVAKPAWIPYGIIGSVTADTLEVQAVSSAEARAAGLRAGDRIVAIDGWKVPVSPAVNALSRGHAAKPEGATTIFTVAGPGEIARDVRLTFSRRHIDDYYHSAGMTFATMEALLIGNDLVAAGALIASAIFLFVRERRKAVPAFLSLGLILGAATLVEDAWNDLGVSAFVGGVVAASANMFILAALFAFPSGELTPRWTRTAVVSLPIFLVGAALSVSPGISQGAFGGYLIAASAALVNRYRRLAPGDEQQQLRWVFFGLVACAATQVVDIAGLIVGSELQSVDARWNAWSVFGNVLAVLGFVVLAFGVIVSILKYRLYDADTVIGRSAAYGVLTFGFIALFAGAEKLAEIVGERYFEHSIGIAAGAVGAAVAAALIVPLHNRVHRWAERRFQKPLIRLREGLPECVSDLRESASVEQLVAAVMKRVEAGVRSTREAVLLADDGMFVLAGTRNIASSNVEGWRSGWSLHAGEQILDCDRRDPIFPLRVRLCIESGDAPETVGWLLLGPRPDGSFFGKDEREALAHIAGPVARAIHIAQLREQREAEAERRLGAVEALVARIGDALKGRTPGASLA